MITWYEDEKLKIMFDKEPDVTMIYPLPYYNKEQKKAAIEKPFLNKKDLYVVINNKTNGLTYSFNIPALYRWDGATIPKVFWRLIGSNTNSEFLIPSMIHDVICENHDYVNNDRYISTIILERLLYCSGVGNFKRWMMKHSVDNYQKLKGKWKNE